MNSAVLQAQQSKQRGTQVIKSQHWLQ